MNGTPKVHPNNIAVQTPNVSARPGALTPAPWRVQHASGRTVDGPLHQNECGVELEIIRKKERRNKERIWCLNHRHVGIIELRNYFLSEASLSSRM